MGFERSTNPLTPVHGEALIVLALPSGHFPPEIRLAVGEPSNPDQTSAPVSFPRHPVCAMTWPEVALCVPLDPEAEPRSSSPVASFLSFLLPPQLPGFRVRLGLRPGARDLEGAGCQGGDEAGGSLLPDPGFVSTSIQECKFLNQVSQALALGSGRVAAVR